MMRSWAGVALLGILGAWCACSSSNEAGVHASSPEGGANTAGDGSPSSTGAQQAGGNTAEGGSPVDVGGSDTASGGAEQSGGVTSAAGTTSAAGATTDGGSSTGSGSTPAAQCSGNAPITSCVTTIVTYSTCNETTGADFELQAAKDQLKNDCALRMGTFGSHCPATNLYGRCIASCGKPFEQITYYYDAELGASGKQTCTHTEGSVWDGP